MLLKSQRSKALRKLLRKFKNQKKQFKHIDKIFSFKKQERTGEEAQNFNDPLIKNIKQPFEDSQTVTVYESEFNCVQPTDKAQNDTEIPNKKIHFVVGSNIQ